MLICGNVSLALGQGPLRRVEAVFMHTRHVMHVY